MELLWSNWDGQNCVGNCFYTVPQNIPNLPPQVSPQGCNNGSATFALPTVVNGNIYIPTWSVQGSVTNGVVVFMHK